MKVVYDDCIDDLVLSERMFIGSDTSFRSKFIVVYAFMLLFLLFYTIINGLSLKLIAMLLLVAMILSSIIFIQNKQLSLLKNSYKIDFKGVSEVEKYFDRNYNSNENVSLYTLFKLTNKIFIDKVEDGLVITLRDINNTKYDRIIKIPKSNIKIVYQRNLLEEVLLVRSTEVILCKRYKEDK